MTAAQLFAILNTVPPNSEVRVMAFDWYPKTQLQIAKVIDATDGGPTIKSPLLVIFAGPNSFNSYDASGYNFPAAPHHSSS